MIYKIEKNISIPTYYWTKFPFKQMLVGDSFFVPETEYPDVNYELMARRLRGGMIRAAERVLKHKYKSRTRVKSGVKGLRIWRVK